MEIDSAVVGNTLSCGQHNRDPGHQDGMETSHHSALVLAFTSLLVGVPLLRAEAQPYTIDNIVAALKAAEAQAPTLKVDYTTERVGETNTEGSAMTRLSAHATFARDKVNGCLYYDTISATLRDVRSGETQTDPGALIAFDGKATLHLERTLDKGRMRATILPGRHDELLKLNGNPHTMYIRGYSGRLFSEWLLLETSKFGVTGSERQADGAMIVKLEGTVGSGFARVSLWLCPERSFLPTRFALVRAKDGVKGMEYSLGDFVKLADGSYYPQKVTLGSDAAPWGHIEVSHISTDPLPEGFFRPKIPPNTHVTDHILKLAYTTDDAIEWALSDDSISAQTSPESHTAYAAATEKNLENYLGQSEQEEGTVGADQKVIGARQTTPVRIGNASTRVPLGWRYAAMGFLIMSTIAVLGTGWLVRKTTRKEAHHERAP
jgi:hypothetical protein